MAERTPRFVRSPRPCGYCEVAFLPLRDVHVFCSPRCHLNARTLKQREERKPLPEQTCGYCREVFVPSRTSAKYCSTPCARQGRGVARRQKRPDLSTARPCQQCTRPFLPTKHWQVFCGPRCAQRNKTRVDQDRKLVKRCRTCAEDKARTDFTNHRFSCDACIELRATGRRRCSWCREIHPLAAFNRNPNSFDGAQSRCRACTRESEQNRMLNVADRVTRRERRLQVAFSLSIEKFDGILRSQGGGCAICGDLPAVDETFHVDHDHRCCPDNNRTCGKCVRGICCASCNQALGFLRDSAERAEAAAAYLRKYAGR